MSEPREIAEQLEDAAAGQLKMDIGLWMRLFTDAAALIGQQATALATAEREREKYRELLNANMERARITLTRAEQAEAALATAREENERLREVVAHGRRMRLEYLRWLDTPELAADVELLNAIDAFGQALDALRVHADAPAARGEGEK